MITWICSYPRSGSAWTRQTLEQLFEQPVCVPEAESFRYVRSLGRHLGFVKTTEDSLAYGLTSKHGQKVWILKDTGRLLNDDAFRNIVADDDREFYVKTHGSAYPEYNPGERVFFIVRHPIAALTSYQRYLKTVRYQTVSLEDLIHGNTDLRADFVTYTEQFLNVCESDSRHLLQHYENKHLHYEDAVRQLAVFVGRPALSVAEAGADNYPTYTSKLKKLSRSKMTSWMGTIPGKTLTSFEQRYALLLKRLGYRMPKLADVIFAEEGGDPALLVGDAQDTQDVRRVAPPRAPPPPRQPREARPWPPTPPPWPPARKVAPRREP